MISIRLRHTFTMPRFLFGFGLSLLLAACTSVRQSTADKSVLEPKAPPKSPTRITQPLKLCDTFVSNPPRANGRLISRPTVNACVDGVDLLIAPAPGACLSSGFGPRNQRPHKGVDYQSRPAGQVVAAAEGKVLRIEYREKDFGHWVILQHDSGVFTGYAHLKSVARNLKPGDHVRQGQVLGVMGNTGNAARAVHLHFEIRQGNFYNAKRWWGLRPLNPFALPADC